MKKRVFIIIYVLINNISLAQFSFNKIVVTNQLNNLNLDSANNIYHFESYKLHVYNSSCDTLVNCFFKLNPLNPVCSLTYAFPRLLFKNSLLVAGFAYDTLNGACNKSFGYLGKYNKNLTKDWERKFSVNNSYGNSNLEVAQNDSEIISTSIAYNISGTTYLRYPFVIVFDTMGNLKWCDKFDILDAYPVTIIQTADGGSILGMNIKDIGAALLKVDSAGNVVWCKSYYRNKSKLIKIIEGDNGNIYLTGIKDTSFATYDNSSSFLIKVDSGGNPDWGIYYSQADRITTIEDLIYNPYSNQLVTVGVHGNTAYGGSYFLTYDINGYSSSLASIYLRNDYDIGVYKIQITSPDSYLIGGRVTNLSTFGGIWLFTADSNGYGICNGFQGSIGYNSFTPVDSDITITYTTGATVVASNDIYITGVQPFTVQDGCLYTGEEDNSESKNLLVIYPNPNNGVFSIEVPTELKQSKNVTLTIYDVKGKLVQEQKHTTGEKLNVNLVSQPKGIYNVTLTNGIKSYCGKVVFE